MHTHSSIWIHSCLPIYVETRSHSVRIHIGHPGAPIAAHVAIQNNTPQLRSTPPLRSKPYCGYVDHLPFFCGRLYH